MKRSGGRAMLVAACAMMAAGAWAQSAKITPLGSHDGELCDRDRATIWKTRAACGFRTMAVIR